MKSCPNHNDEAYKLLESSLGKETAYAIFIANDEVLPTLEAAKRIIQLNEKHYEDEISKIIDELKNAESSKIVNTINEYFTIISNHLRNLREKRSYDRLRKIFTTSDNINKLSTLQDILKEADKAQEDIPGLQRRVRALALSIIQMEHLSDLMIEDVQELIKNPGDSIENLKNLQSYLNTISDWEILLKTASDTFGIGNPTITKKVGEVSEKLKQIESLISNNDESGVIQTLKDILVPASNNFIKIISEKKDLAQKRLNNQIARGASENTINSTKKQIEAFDKKIKEIDFENNQNIIDFLKGKRGDASFFNSMLESFRDSTDPTTSAFITFIKNFTDEVNTDAYKFDLSYQKELSKLITDKERLDPQSLGRKLTFIDNDSQIKLLNPWRNYSKDYNDLKLIEKELKDKFLSNKSEDSKNEYLLAKKNRQSFEQKYLYTEFIPEVYEKYKLFDDEIGTSLKEDIDLIFDQIRQIDEKYNLFGKDLTDEDLDAKEALMREYKLLGNLNNIDGSPKEGIALKKAERMKEIRALNSKYYEWKDNKTMFEKAKTRYSESLISQGLSEDSADYINKMKDWEDENTRTVILDSFYKKRDSILKEISLITNKNKDLKLSKNIEELWKEITSLVYGSRDEDNQPIGTLIQKKGSERIKVAQESIQDLQNQLTGISGLTRAEQHELNELFSKSKSGALSPTDSLDMEDLLGKSKDFGLSPTQKKRLFSLFEDLKLLQSKIPTSYYVDTFNQLSLSQNIIIDDLGNYKNKPILESNELEELLKDKTFSDWFNLNHIQVERFNPDTKTTQTKWERTYQWNRIIPNEEKYQEIKPALKYSYREIRSEYKTGYNPTTKKVELKIGEHIDNKGNWLPNPNKKDSSIYKNEAYFNLKNGTDSESMRLSKILDIHTKRLLESQENLSRNNRVYLSLPNVERSKSERNLDFIKKALSNPGSIPKLIWDQIKEEYHNLTSFNTTDNRYEPIFDGKYAKDFIGIPMKYSSPIDNPSLDIFKSISKYNQAAELNKKLVETLPVAKAISRIIERADEHKSSDRRQNNRIRAIRRIVNREWAGEKSNLDLKKFGSFEKPVQATIAVAKYLSGWAMIKVNFASAFANLTNAITQNWVNAGQDLFSKKSYAYSAIAYSEFALNWQKDYWENKLGKSSLETQMADLWEPVQGENLTKHIGEKASQSKIWDTLGLNPIFHFREWTEYYVQSRTWLAALYEQKVDYNGEIIPLLKAYELDSNGFMKLKDGIDKSWEVNGANFNRLKSKIQAINRRIHGNYAEFDKSQLEMYAFGSLALYLKRFFISMWNNRFANDRWNIATGLQNGFYTTTAKIAIRQIQNGLKDWDGLSIDEKQALAKTSMEAGIIIGSLLLMGLIGYSGDDKNKKQHLEEYSWLELQTLYQLDRLFVETSGWVRPSNYLDYVTQFQIATGLQKWLKFFSDFVSQSEYKTSSSIAKKGDKKWPVQLRRATGIQQLMLMKDDPDQLLLNYDRNIRGR